MQIIIHFHTSHQKRTYRCLFVATATHTASVQNVHTYEYLKMVHKHPSGYFLVPNKHMLSKYCLFLLLNYSSLLKQFHTIVDSVAKRNC